MKKFFLMSFSLIALTCIVASAVEGDGDSAPAFEEPVGGGRPVSGSPGGNAPWDRRKFLNDSLGIDNIPQDLKVVSMVNEDGKKVLALNTRNPQIRVYIDDETGETKLKNINVNPAKSIPIREFEDQIAKNEGIQFTVNDQIKQIYAGWQNGPNRDSFPPIAKLAYDYAVQQTSLRSSSQDGRQGSSGPRGRVGGDGGEASSQIPPPPGHAGEVGSGQRTEKKPRTQDNRPASQFKEMALKYKGTNSIGVSKEELAALATEPAKPKETRFKKQGKIAMRCYTLDEAGNDRQAFDADYFISTDGQSTWINPFQSPEVAWERKALVGKSDELGTAVGRIISEEDGKTYSNQLRVKKITNPGSKKRSRLMIQAVSREIPQGMKADDPSLFSENQEGGVGMYCLERFPEQEQVEAGKVEFENKCMVCHDGVEHPTLIGSLKKQPKKGGSGVTILQEAIRRMELPKGAKGRMPDAETVLSPKEIEDIKAYLEDAAEQE